MISHVPHHPNHPPNPSFRGRPKVICRYFTYDNPLRTCYRGDDCTYLHLDPSGTDVRGSHHEIGGSPSEVSRGRGQIPSRGRGGGGGVASGANAIGPGPGMGGIRRGRGGDEEPFRSSREIEEEREQARIFPSPKRARSALSGIIHRDPNEPPPLLPSRRAAEMGPPGRANTFAASGYTHSGSVLSSPHRGHARRASQDSLLGGSARRNRFANYEDEEEFREVGSRYTLPFEMEGTPAPGPGGRGIKREREEFGGELFEINTGNDSRLSRDFAAMGMERSRDRWGSRDRAGWRGQESDNESERMDIDMESDREREERRIREWEEMQKERKMEQQKQGHWKEPRSTFKKNRWNPITGPEDNAGSEAFSNNTGPPERTSSAMSIDRRKENERPTPQNFNPDFLPKKPPTPVPAPPERTNLAPLQTAPEPQAQKPVEMPPPPTSTMNSSSSTITPTTSTAGPSSATAAVNAAAAWLSAKVNFPKPYGHKRTASDEHPTPTTSFEVRTPTLLNFTPKTPLEEELFTPSGPEPSKEPAKMPHKPQEKAPERVRGPWVPYTPPTFIPSETLVLEKEEDIMFLESWQGPLSALIFTETFPIRDSHLRMLAMSPHAPRIQSLTAGSVATGTGSSLTDNGLLDFLEQARSLKILTLHSAIQITDLSLLHSFRTCKALEYVRISGNDVVPGRLTRNLWHTLMKYPKLKAGLKRVDWVYQRGKEVEEKWVFGASVGSREGGPVEIWLGEGRGVWDGKEIKRG